MNYKFLLFKNIVKGFISGQFIKTYDVDNYLIFYKHLLIYVR